MEHEASPEVMFASPITDAALFIFIKLALNAPVPATFATPITYCALRGQCLQPLSCLFPSEID